MKTYLSRRLRPFRIGFAIVVGTLSTMVLATGCTHPPAAGMAASFDGTTGEVSIPVVTKATENVTLESWVKLPDGAKGCLIKVGSGTGYGLGVAAAGNRFDDSNPGNALIGLYENVA
jgi:hypothetical protein